MIVVATLTLGQIGLLAIYANAVLVAAALVKWPTGTNQSQRIKTSKPFGATFAAALAKDLNLFFALVADAITRNNRLRQ